MERVHVIDQVSDLSQVILWYWEHSVGLSLFLARSLETDVGMDWLL